MEAVQPQELSRRAVKKASADVMAEEWIEAQKYRETDAVSSVRAHRSHHFNVVLKSSLHLLLFRCFLTWLSVATRRCRSKPTLVVSFYLAL